MVLINETVRWDYVAVCSDNDCKNMFARASMNEPYSYLHIQLLNDE